MAKVELTDEALEDLKDLDGASQKIVLKGLRKLAANPDQYGQPLGKRNAGDLTGFRKLVVGRKAFRILYMVHENDDGSDITLVVVWVIAERADDRVYQLAVSRLQTMQHREIATDIEQLLVSVFSKKPVSIARRPSGSAESSGGGTG